ncbi:hypothetical protein ACFL3E_00230 [Patescibacteria group bacterium]
MQKLEDAVIEVYFNRDLLNVWPNGCVGCLTAGVANIQVHVPSFGVEGFHVDLKGNVIPKKDLLKEDPTLRKYRFTVSVKKNKDDIYCTFYKEGNSMGLVKIVVEDLQIFIEFWEIAFISQNGNFFLTTQCTHKEKCFYDADRDVGICPALEYEFKDRPALLVFIRTFLAGYPYIDEMTPIQDYKFSQIDASDLEEGTGKVLWWNFSRGFGAILTPKGVARTHWTQIPARDGLAYLEKGELVNYDLLHSPSGNTSFELEAVGIIV